MWHIQSWSTPDRTWSSGTGQGFKAEPGVGVEAILYSWLIRRFCFRFMIIEGFDLQFIEG